MSGLPSSSFALGGPDTATRSKTVWQVKLFLLGKNVAADCSTDGLQGNQVSLGASYSFSKRTQLYVIAARLSNGKSARLNNADWLADVTPGTDNNQVALGIVHSF